MRRHDLDLVSLIAGAVFAAVALVHLVGAATDEHVDGTWLAPVLLVGLGVAGLAGALRGSRRAEHNDAESTSDEA
ncbi:MAG: hypothetical protein ACRDV2_05590 [Actinomycetes bacterium]